VYEEPRAELFMPQMLLIFRPALQTAYTGPNFTTI
jgi:hypothetical protein